MHLGVIHYKRKAIVENEPPIMRSERLCARDVILEADYDQVVKRCEDLLRATGAKFFEIIHEDDDHALIFTLRENGSFWSRFTARGVSLDELVIDISREEDSKCLIRVETSISDELDKSMVYITKFINHLIK